MTTQLQLTPLRRPEWATDRWVDESFIEFVRPMGSVGTCGDDPAFEVAVIQQDELDLAADPPAVERHEVQIRLAGVRITAAQARELAALLVTSADLVDSKADHA